MPDNLVQLVERAAQLWPKSVAWIFDETDRQFTFTEIDRTSSDIAETLTSRGVRSGDHVAAMLRNQPEFPLLWLALAKIGAAIVPMNVKYQERDSIHILRNSQARFAVTSAEFAELLNHVRHDTLVDQVIPAKDLWHLSKRTVSTYRATGEQVANIQYTSGTTGAPKGCVLPHRYWATLAAGLVSEFPFLTSADTILTAQPFHYIDPQWNVAAGLASGAKLVVLDGFHPSTFWQKIRKHRVSWFYCLGLMPTLLLRMPSSSDDIKHHVRSIMASAIPTNLHRQLEQRWKTPWFEAFGMTETGADIRVTPAEHDHALGTNCIGRPVAYRNAMIVDDNDQPVPPDNEGELILRGPGMMLGYYNDSDATSRVFRNGWFHTGDRATMDHVGRIYYVGRTKDMIRRSGENIAASEVEQTLLTHPAVKVAAVVAVPDDLRGEEAQANIVLESEYQPTVSTAETIASYCANKLASFKIPRYWRFTASLPLTPSQRVAKRTLQERGIIGSYDRMARLWRQ